MIVWFLFSEYYRAFSDSRFRFGVWEDNSIRCILVLNNCRWYQSDDIIVSSKTVWRCFWLNKSISLRISFLGSIYAVWLGMDMKCFSLRYTLFIFLVWAPLFLVAWCSS